MAAVQSRQSDQFADLTAFQRDILWVLSHDGGAAYGLRIKELLEEQYDTINHGRLYPNLDDLVDEGYIAKSERDRRTNDYELTETGTQLLAERQAWERGEE